MKAKFTGEGGYDFDKEKALSKLEVGKEYLIEDAFVGGWSSYVRINGELYSSVLFNLTAQDLLEEFPNSNQLI